MSIYADAKTFAAQEIERENKRKLDQAAELKRQEDKFVAEAESLLAPARRMLDEVVQELRRDGARADLKSGYRRSDGYYVDFSFSLPMELDPVQSHYTYQLTLVGAWIVEAHVVGMDEAVARNVRFRTEGSDPHLIDKISEGVKRMLGSALIKGNSLRFQ